MFLNVNRTLSTKLASLKANITQQTHSANIQTIGQTKHKNFDGFVTDDLNAHMIIYTSDCLPIIGVNDHSQFIIHAGWKGLLSGIIPNLVSHPLIKGTYDIFIAPHLDMKNFEVKSDFVEQWSHIQDFDEFYKNNHFNASGYAKKQLAPITNNIQISNLCTFDDTRFASYRRNGNLLLTNLTIHNITFD